MMKYIFLLQFFPLYSIQAQENFPPATVETVLLSEDIPTMGRLGGVTVDQLGFIYLADFRETVWKIDPTGQATSFVSGLYGASGNAIDQSGNLIQSNFFANSVWKIDRNGQVLQKYTKNMNGPVGVVTGNNGELFVCNCAGNYISKINSEGESSIFSKSDLFNCPNGITVTPDGILFVTNYGNDIIVQINQEGISEKFTMVQGGQGNAHIVFMKDNFYVTKIKTNTIFRVTPDGKSFLLAGNASTRGFKDGEATEATFAQPNGIAKDAYGSTLYVNTLQGKWVINGPGAPGIISLRKIDIKTITEIFKERLEKDGLEAAVNAYLSYKNDPTHAHEDTAAETATYGWQLMIERKIPEAIRVFELLSESYPKRWRPFFYLGQVHTMIGKNDKAISYYQQSLQINPNNPLVETKLNLLKGE